MKGSSKAALGVGATIGAGGTILAVVLIILGGSYILNSDWSNNRYPFNNTRGFDNDWSNRK